MGNQTRSLERTGCSTRVHAEAVRSLPIVLPFLCLFTALAQSSMAPKMAIANGGQGDGSGVRRRGPRRRSYRPRLLSVETHFGKI